jgi:hypothetical protein
MKKINDFKNDALKVERVPNIFENLNSFETMLKMIKKNDANVLKMYFLDFQCFSLFLNFFMKIYQTWVKNWVATDAPSLQCLRSKTPQCFA